MTDADAATDAATDQPASLLTHLNELRWRIVKMAIGVAVGAVIGFTLADPIKGLLEAPYLEACGGCTFLALAPGEQFSVLMRIATFTGIILGSPVVIYQIWAFVNPALTDRERKWTVPIVGACVLLFVTGVGFGYLSLPKALEFLINIFPEVQANFRLGDYFSFVLRFLLAFGLSFLYPVFLFAAAAAGLVTSRQLAQSRRWAVLAIVIAASVITPTGDALTLALLGVPLYVFYELTYWLVRLILRK